MKMLKVLFGLTLASLSTMKASAQDTGSGNGAGMAERVSNPVVLRVTKSGAVEIEFIKEKIEYPYSTNSIALTNGHSKIVGVLPSGQTVEVEKVLVIDTSTGDANQN